MAEISAVALKAVTGLAKPLTSLGLKKLKKLKPIQRFRIEQAIESAFAEVWDALDSYFTTEKLDDHRRELIGEACARELRPYAEDVDRLLSDSLDGEKLFENLRTAEPFPQEIQDEKLEQVYRMVFPLVASILCKAPVIIEQVDERNSTRFCRALTL